MFIDKFFSPTLYDLVAEFFEHVRAAVSIGNLHPKTDDHIPSLVEDLQTQGDEIKSAAGTVVDTQTHQNPEMWFIKMVEDGLRKFPDFIKLGQSPLVHYSGVNGENQIERGKQLQRLLHDAIESLRPSGARPADLLPRAWYNYVVLHDAYVEGAPNYEVMARLYISEGTFNRTRRNALRGVAIYLIEAIAQKDNRN